MTELSAAKEISVRVRGRSLRVVLTPDLEGGGYGIEVPELPGCFSQGDDLRDAASMVREAIELWLEASADVHGGKPRLPSTVHR